MDMKESSIRGGIRKMKENGFVYSSSIVKWTEEEIHKLKELAITHTTEEIAEILNKTEKQVYNKAVKLKISVNRNRRNLWTEEDTKILLNLYDSYEFHLIVKVMKKSEATIKIKAKELGLELKFKNRTKWTLSEEQLLKEYAEIYTVSEIASLLERTISSINSKLKNMGITALPSSKYWTKEEEEQLKNFAKELSTEEIAQKMNKSYEAVNQKLYQLGIKAQNSFNRRWTEEEKIQLFELLASYSTLEVSRILKRSEEAIIEKAIRLGYNIDSRNRRWTEEEETLLSDLWGIESIEKIANKLNRTIYSITNKVHDLGLGSQIDNNYDGLKIHEISDILGVNRNVILTSWVSLGLKLNFRRRSDHSTYAYVEIKDLYAFLEANPNIWDSRTLEKNILGIEPEWLKEKRRRDRLSQIGDFGLESLTKQQLLLAKQYFLDLNQEKEDKESASGPRLLKTKEIKKR